MMSTERPAEEFVPGLTLTQLFRAEADALSTVTVILATWGRKPEGEVTLRLRRVKRDLKPRMRSWTSLFGSRRRSYFNALGDDDGELLVALTLTEGDIDDNMYVTLHLPKPDVRAGDLLVLTIEAFGSQPGAAATAWMSNGTERLPGHVALYSRQYHQLEYGLRARTAYAPLLAETPVPTHLMWSPVTQCNLNCPHCISQETRKSVKRLPETIREQIRSWVAAGHLKEIASDYSGDILWADARFGGELDFLIDLDVSFVIDTNGSHLTPEVSERLARSKLDHLSISLDAATEETFRRVRKGAPPLAKVIENIRSAVQARGRLGGTHRIAISFTLMRSNLDEFPDFLRLAHSLGLEIVYARHLMPFTPEMAEDSLWHERERFNAVRLESIALANELGISHLFIPEPFTTKRVVGRLPCSIPWYGAGVLGNGDVLACCVPGLKMGNLHENTMEEIWNGPRYQELRWSVNSANPPAPCKTCPIIRDINDRDSYLIHEAKARLAT
ncbi:radical SAM protein [Methylobacterium brachiatum]|uniref:Radical SAM protein n=1 Tax=Methylobacterium brachiatum TaxID=269660 RepID=A0ABV1RAQ8_9HYPH